MSHPYSLLLLRKYPIKEPFVELMKGSLNTFLNAFTYPDRTCYPVASTNTQVGQTATRLYSLSQCHHGYDCHKAVILALLISSNSCCNS